MPQDNPNITTEITIHMKDGRSITLTLDEARRVYDRLEPLFRPKTVPTTTPYPCPQYPYPYDPYTYPWGPVVYPYGTWCISGSSDPAT